MLTLKEFGALKFGPRRNSTAATLRTSDQGALLIELNSKLYAQGTIKKKKKKSTRVIEVSRPGYHVGELVGNPA